MAKFNFKFDSIKKMKVTFEKKAQKELAQIDSFIAQHEELKKKLIEAVNSLKNSAHNKKVCVSELKFISGYKNLLNLKIEEKNKEIKLLQKKKEEKVEEVIQKTKEKKMLNKLEASHHEDFIACENKNEMKNFDDIAVQNYVRSVK